MTVHDLHKQTLLSGHTKHLQYICYYTKRLI